MWFVMSVYLSDFVGWIAQKVVCSVGYLEFFYQANFLTNKFLSSVFRLGFLNMVSIFETSLPSNYFNAHSAVAYMPNSVAKVMDLSNAV